MKKLHRTVSDQSELEQTTLSQNLEKAQLKALDDCAGALLYDCCSLRGRSFMLKNKTLKHYKRKKFFYRFFMRKSPRSGAMFGLAWMNMVIALIPFFVFCIFQIVGRCESWGGFISSSVIDARTSGRSQSSEFINS